MARFSVVVWIFVTLALIQLGVTHSWVETVQLIGADGAFMGSPGYAMGYLPRDPSDPDLDNKVLNRIETLASDPIMCRQFAQGDYPNKQFQPLTASAGDFLALQYLENGHVTQPDLVPNKPYRSGNVYVYGTLEHTPDAKVNDIRNTWTADGTGGNKKGKLLAAHYYDDGQCYQDRGAAGPNFPIYMDRKSHYNQRELTCQTDAQLPKDLPSSGTYTLYWLWDWPTNNGMTGNTTEIYTSCVRINLAASSKASSQSITFKASSIQQAAISSQLKTPIEALTLGVGSSSPPAPTPTATATGTNAKGTGKTPSSTGKATPTSGAGGGTGKAITVTVTKSVEASGRVKTVTVLAEAATITRYQTVTVGGGGAAGSAAKTTQPAAPTTLKTSVRPNSNTTSAGAPANRARVTSVTPFM